MSVLICECDRFPLLHVHGSPHGWMPSSPSRDAGWGYDVRKWRENIRPATWVERAAWSADLAAAK